MTSVLNGTEETALGKEIRAARVTVDRALAKQVGEDLLQGDVNYSDLREKYGVSAGTVVAIKRGTHRALSSSMAAQLRKKVGVKKVGRKNRRKAAAAAEPVIERKERKYTRRAPVASAPKSFEDVLLTLRDAMKREGIASFTINQDGHATVVQSRDCVVW